MIGPISSRGRELGVHDKAIKSISSEKRLNKDAGRWTETLLEGFSQEIRRLCLTSDRGFGKRGERATASQSHFIRLAGGVWTTRDGADMWLSMAPAKARPAVIVERILDYRNGFMPINWNISGRLFLNIIKHHPLCAGTPVCLAYRQWLLSSSGRRAHRAFDRGERSRTTHTASLHGRWSM